MTNINELPFLFCLIVTEVKKFSSYGIENDSIVYCQKSNDNNENGIKVFFKDGEFELSKNPIDGYAQVGRVISVIKNRRQYYGTQESIC